LEGCSGAASATISPIAQLDREVSGAWLQGDLARSIHAAIRLVPGRLMREVDA
jgi:hypothetical protein